MTVRNTIFWIVRIIGWTFGIGAIVAKYQNYEGWFAYIYEPSALKFYLTNAAFNELLFVNNKLMLEIEKLKKGSSALK
jgi:hypothetical protein